MKMEKQNEKNKKLKNKALKSVAGGGPDDNLPPIAKYLYEKDWTEEEEIEKEKRKKNIMGRWS